MTPTPTLKELAERPGVRAPNNVAGYMLEEEAARMLPRGTKVVDGRGRIMRVARAKRPDAGGKFVWEERDVGLGQERAPIPGAMCTVLGAKVGAKR